MDEICVVGLLSHSGGSYHVTALTKHFRWGYELYLSAPRRKLGPSRSLSLYCRTELTSTSSSTCIYRTRSSLLAVVVPWHSWTCAITSSSATCSMNALSWTISRCHQHTCTLADDDRLTTHQNLATWPPTWPATLFTSNTPRCIVPSTPQIGRLPHGALPLRPTATSPWRLLEGWRKDYVLHARELSVEGGVNIDKLLP